jgi:hypothetical protein
VILITTWYWQNSGREFQYVNEKIKFGLERCDLKKLDDVEVKEKYHIEFSSTYAGLDSLDQSFDINNAWKNVREDINSSAKSDL